MALKFLNKKGWHTGSLRNIENVWKAEQKHEAEKRKLEELKKQIHEEREAQEFRHLQEQAGLVPKQERLEFLYDSGLAVGRNSTDDYLLGKPLEENKREEDVSKVAAAPGALFVEEKPQSANDAWRKLHTDPLLLIRQQEQAAIARIKNNPVKMELIKRSVQEKIVNKEKRKHKDGKIRKHKEKRRKRHGLGATSELMDTLLKGDDYERKSWSHEKEPRLGSPKRKYSSSTRANDNLLRSHDKARKRSKSLERSIRGSPRRWQDTPIRGNDDCKERHDNLERGWDTFEKNSERRHDHLERRHDRSRKRYDTSDTPGTGKREENEDHHKVCHTDIESSVMEKHKQKSKQESRKLTEEEKAARLKAMQNDADVHEEQRWHRLKKASDTDRFEEARRLLPSSGPNFVDQTAMDIYGAARGGSNSVEESVRRRAHFIERSLGDSNFNTFQRL